MVDQRTIELIHAEIDGELDAQGLAELEQRLQVSARARELQLELRKISQALDRMSAVPVPAGLRQRVLDSGTAHPLKLRARRPRGRRLALALAAGIVFAAVTFVLLETPSSALRTGQLAATMVPPAQGVPAPALIERRLSGPTLDGVVALHPSGGNWQLSFDLRSAEPVIVTLAYDATLVRLNARGQAESGAGIFTVAPGSIGFVSIGSQHRVFEIEGDRGGALQVRLEASGQVLQDLQLDIPDGVGEP